MFIFQYYFRNKAIRLLQYFRQKNAIWVHTHILTHFVPIRRTWRLDIRIMFYQIFLRIYYRFHDFFKNSYYFKVLKNRVNSPSYSLLIVIM